MRMDTLLDLARVHIAMMNAYDYGVALRITQACVTPPLLLANGIRVRIYLYLF